MTDKKETTSKLKDEVLEMVEAGASPQEIFDKHGEAIGNITDGIGTEEMMKRAMAGFSRMAKDNGIELDDIRIIRVGRSEEEGIEAEDKQIPNIEEYQRLFLKCLDIYNIKKQLKWR